ncbi:hypothetical protein [Lentibacillus salinarum]|uniref:Uncharacterized protein n=1 Tax=Lentibacillus salinarum TaxID=446820 RepID=A0ABW3ZSY9_9BACI
MNKQLLDVVDYTRETLGLHNYQLERYYFFREKTLLNETMYSVSMEWFPNDAEMTTENELNPEGTAVVDVDFHTKAIRRLMFIGDVNRADHNVYPTSEAKEEAIEWIEDMTGLVFGRQFLIAREEEQVLQFGAAVDNIPVSPGGIIRTTFNDDGVLTDFYIDGDFPNEEQIRWEPFALTPDKYEPVAEAQCKLLTLPDQEQEKWVPVYGIEEVFLTNDTGRTMPFTFGADRSSFVMKDEALQWDEPLDGEFETEDIDLSPEVTLETVLANEPHPDTFPLTEAEITACEREALRFMRLVYPDESGKRQLTGLYLKDGYIVAEIKPIEKAQNVLDIKVKLLIERNTLTAVNYIDQARLYEMFQQFAAAGEPVVSQREAFEVLREYVDAEPVYVYDTSRDRYIMCGKIDCDYSVNAVTGEVMALNEMG